jgi:N-sulfoglucosamine sulfohydrolase
MRCVQNQRFGYIFNPWSDGRRVFRNESQAGLTFNAMKAAAGTNDSVAARVKLFQYRLVEEFYDFKNDPDALHNLIDDPTYKQEIQSMRDALLEWMRKTGDPAREAFENRTSPQALSKFMAEQDAAAGRKQSKPKQQKKQQARKAKPQG